MLFRSADRNFVSGVVVTQDRVAHTAREKSELAGSGASAVDMEAAAVAAHSKRARLPFACVKVVSDPAAEDLVVDFNNMRSEDGRISRGKIGIYALTHPNKIAGLFAVKRRVDKSAKVLGEFLVSCRVNPVPDSAEGIESKSAE